ncbi:MAG: LOG family protein [Anaerolineales bacterium]|nr:LOG family protein [Anaerolineales bacterium]
MTKVISVFGGSSPRAEDPAYKQAEKLGGLLAEQGFAVANGGYCGVMEAVSKGAAQAGGTVIGVTCTHLEAYRPIGPNPWITREIRVERVSSRLQKLIEVGDGLVALPGGIGTLAEIVQSWSWLQTGEIEPKPLILVGSLWLEVFSLFQEQAKEYLSFRDQDLLEFVPDESAAAASLALRFLGE